MNRILMLVAVALLGSGWLVACKTDGTKTVTTNPASVAAVKAQFDILRDSVDGQWRQMIRRDDEKIGSVDLLLKELTQRPGVDANQLLPLTRATSTLKSRRYNQVTMAQSDLIDRYDTAQDSVLRSLYELAAPGGNAPTAQIRDFTEGIQQNHSTVILYRIRYDRAAKNYNNYLKLHREELSSLGRKYAPLQPLPLFELPQ